MNTDQLITQIDYLISLREIYQIPNYDRDDCPSNRSIELAINILLMLKERNINPELINRTAESGISFHIVLGSYHRILISKEGEILCIEDKNDLDAYYQETDLEGIVSYLDILKLKGDKNG